MKNKLMVWLLGMVLSSLDKSQFNFALVETSISKFFEWTYKLHPQKFMSSIKSFIKRKSFVYHIEQVNVKKGKRKYTLLFIKTQEGTVRVNLGRHREAPQVGYDSYELKQSEEIIEPTSNF